MDTVANDFDTALTAFLSSTQAALASHYAMHYKNLTAPVLSTEVGPKYVRVVKSQPGQRSVFCFVRRADGAVLKAAGWKAPAKHVRGSIYINEGRDAVDVYGARCLR